MLKVNMHEAKTQLSRLVERALAGEEVVIARSGKALVRLDVLPQAQSKRILGEQPELLLRMADDFDAETEDFADYMP